MGALQRRPSAASFRRSGWLPRAHAPRAAPPSEASEEKEETCGFCRFMKAGPCGTVFAAWEGCVDANREGGADTFVEQCMVQTRGLKECMEANPEYYGPLLEGEGEEETLDGGEGAAEGDAQGSDAGAKKADGAPSEQAPEEAAPPAAAPQPAAPKERR